MLLSTILAISALPTLSSQADDAYLAGYLIIPTGERVERSYNAGFSMYVAVWPLLGTYPGHRFQTGLPGTWMFAQYDGPAPKDMYSDVEGGLGWWTDTRFPTTTPKFIMGGVGPNFSEIANGPSHGAGDWKDPKGLYGVAQLSPWLLFPIDGLNLKQGSCGGYLGYGYLDLPLLQPKPTTDGEAVPTGGRCWTLFLNSGNFKGPVAFFTPHFWSHCAVKDRRLVGQLLDSRPVEPNTAIQMETQYIPCRIAQDSKGESYARISPTSFPRDPIGDSVLIRDARSYDRSALWNSVASWFAGGAASKGLIDTQGAFARTFKDNGYATWGIRTRGEAGKERDTPIEWNSFATSITPDKHAFGFRWGQAASRRGSGGALVTIPEYFHLAKGADGGKDKWVPVAEADVPPATGLTEIRWTRPSEEAQEPYATPTDATSCWRKPGPAAGPFKARLGDGTVVTYYWYRFADQPAMLNAGLSPAERERAQKLVVKLHRLWRKDGQYLPPPTSGTLADLDPAQIVKPPRGLEVGYVPIATRQELAR